MRKEMISFLEGLLSTLHPWFAVIVLVLNWITKPRMKYYSQRPTSVFFLAGMPIGSILGYGLFKEYLQWWLDYRGDLLTIVAGSRPVWLLIVLLGLAIWGILRGSKDETGRSG
ncbi:hypothetical protein [Thermococcus zilligii]|uniref:hypothetical protein n=1 Tax=Thermococcus zilligii TaxID=54076 RepID=UPI00029B44B3|nr:hypothetical protein [Thermococcus zilligii]